MRHPRILLAVGALLFGALAVLTTASSAQAQFTLAVAPPRLRVEVRTERPSPQDVWIRGSWQADHGQYVWAPGRWEAPQQDGQTWQDMRWTHRGTHWVSTPGHWVTRGVYAREAPPPDRSERRGARPDPDHVWVAGYWQWNARQYEWVSGRWETPQQPGATWNRPRWQQRGNQWAFSAGAWRGGVNVEAPAPTPRAVYVQQPAPPPQVVYVQQPAPPPQTVYVRQPAPPPQTVYVQQPAPPPHVVFVPQPAAPRPAVVVVQPPPQHHDEGHGHEQDHGDQGHGGDGHDHGHNH